jgi:hypothetical protein
MELCVMTTRLKPRKKIAPLALIGAFILGGTFAAGAFAERTLGSREAQSSIITLFGGKYPKNQVRVKRVIPGFSSRDAVVEAEIDATFKFTRTERGDWKPTEVRLGDRDWRRIEDIQEKTPAAPAQASN